MINVFKNGVHRRFHFPLPADDPTPVRSEEQRLVSDLGVVTMALDGSARFNGLAYEDLGGDVKHNLITGSTDEQAQFHALRADWERRGSPHVTLHPKPAAQQCTPVLFAGLPYEKLGFDVKHNLLHGTDDEKREYAALHADWKKRGEPLCRPQAQ